MGVDRQILCRSIISPNALSQKSANMHVVVAKITQWIKRKVECATEQKNRRQRTEKITEVSIHGQNW